MVAAHEIFLNIDNMTVDTTRLGACVTDVLSEFNQATHNYGAFQSQHEGYAILLEEVEELWAEIKAKQASPSRRSRCHKEAVQVAAMALRFLYDLGE